MAEAMPLRHTETRRGLACLSRPAKGLAQFEFGLFQNTFLIGWQVPAGAVDVEIQHGHRRGERVRLAPLAGQRGTLQRLSDSSGVLPLKHAGFQVQRVTRSGHLA